MLRSYTCSNISEGDNTMIAHEYSNSKDITAASVAMVQHPPSAAIQHSYAFRCGVDDARQAEPFAPEFWVANWYELAEYANGYLSVRPSHKIANEWLNRWLVEELASTPPAPSYVVNGEWIEA